MVVLEEQIVPASVCQQLHKMSHRLTVFPSFLFRQTFKKETTKSVRDESICGRVQSEISLDCEWVEEELCGAVHWGGLGVWDWASLVITLYSDKIKGSLSCHIQHWGEQSAVVPLINQTLFFSQSTHCATHPGSARETIIRSSFKILVQFSCPDFWAHNKSSCCTLAAGNYS